MLPFPELRPTLWDGLVVLAVILLAAVILASAWSGGEDGGALAVVVSADGEEIDRFPPGELPDSPRIYENNGYTLRLAASPASGGDGVRVEAADCPTQDCVHTGIISRGGQSIVCLPARIIIRLEGGPPPETVVDAVTG